MKFVFTNNGDKFITNKVVDVIKEAQDLNVGEIILNNIDKDGSFIDQKNADKKNLDELTIQVFGWKEKFKKTLSDILIVQ